ncbi:MAG: ribulose-phosphate 3-epimerase [Ginsengibacter sp.]
MSIIAPSLLAANFLKLGEECAMINASEATQLHLDVMDGRFVPNISYGFPVIEQVRKVINKICEVHLMIVEPEKYIEESKRVGADILTIHLEVCHNLYSNIQQIKMLGMQAGIAINPHTPVDLLKDILPDIDLVCLMSVNPGYGGQSFIPHSLEKIKQLRRLIDEGGLKVKIEVDGGVTLENAKQIVDAGADILVAGSAVFKSPDPIATIKKFKSIG